MTKNNMQKCLPLLVKSPQIPCILNYGDPNVPYFEKDFFESMKFNSQINTHNRTVVFEFVDSLPIVTFSE